MKRKVANLEVKNAVLLDYLLEILKVKPMGTKNANLMAALMGLAMAALMEILLESTRERLMVQLKRSVSSIG